MTSADWITKSMSLDRSGRAEAASLCISALLEFRKEILGPTIDLDDVVDLDGDGEDVHGDGEEVYGAGEELNGHVKDVNRDGEEVNGHGPSQGTFAGLSDIPGEEEDTDDSDLSDLYTDSNYELEHDIFDDPKFDENVNGDPDTVPEFEEMGYEGYCSDEVCNSNGLESLAGNETEHDEEGNPIKMPTRLVLFPNSEHRHCVRHLHNNFKQKHPGEVLKQLMWNAARSTTVPWFNKHMDEMKMVKDKAVD
ncbi:hypothetical protein ACLB2K_036801 [Fragaria x ananassa]